MFPGDSRSAWPEHLITDWRSAHFWDERKVLGSWFGKFPEYKTEDDVLWDAVLLYGPGVSGRIGRLRPSPGADRSSGIGSSSKNLFTGC